jgi:hypothetical protein
LNVLDPKKTRGLMVEYSLKLKINSNSAMN